MQIEAEAEQTHGGFLRDKRISVYTAWLDNVNGLTIKENAAWNAIDAYLEARDSKTATAVTEAVQAVRDHLLAMESVEVQLSILASSESSAAAKKLMAAHREVADGMEKMQANPEGVEDLGSREETLKRLDEALEETQGMAAALGEVGILAPEEEGQAEGSTSLDAFREAIEASGESRSRLYGAALRGKASDQYADFIAAAREDLKVDHLIP